MEDSTPLGLILTASRRGVPVGLRVPRNSAAMIKGVTWQMDNFSYGGEDRLTMCLSRNANDQLDPPNRPEMFAQGDSLLGLLNIKHDEASAVARNFDLLTWELTIDQMILPPLIAVVSNDTSIGIRFRVTVRYDIVRLSLADRASLLWRSITRPEKLAG